MRNIALLMSYMGTNYAGFQAQTGKLKTIQGCLEQALEQLTGEKTVIHGSGRTDAGVHARAQVVHFHTSSQIPLQKWRIALNTLLPKDIVIHAASEVPHTFHARKSALRKTYHYSIINHHIPDVFCRETEYRHPTKLDVTAMQAALPYLQGTHDFRSFCTTSSTKTSHIRTIHQLDLQQEAADIAGIDARKIHFSITADGFLYNMVRIIVGTLIQIGEQKYEPAAMQSILDARNRAMAGPTAKPEGLTLWEVHYAHDFDWI